LAFDDFFSQLFPDGDAGISMLTYLITDLHSAYPPAERGT